MTRQSKRQFRQFFIQAAGPRSASGSPFDDPWPGHAPGAQPDTKKSLKKAAKSSKKWSISKLIHLLRPCLWFQKIRELSCFDPGCVASWVRIYPSRRRDGHSKTSPHHSRRGCGSLVIFLFGWFHSFGPCEHHHMAIWFDIAMVQNIFGHAEDWQTGKIIFCIVDLIGQSEDCNGWFHKFRFHLKHQSINW